MFEALGEKLDGVLRRVRGHTRLTEKNINALALNRGVWYHGC